MDVGSPTLERKGAKVIQFGLGSFITKGQDVPRKRTSSDDFLDADHARDSLSGGWRGDILWHVGTCCDMLRHVATCCNML